MFDIDLQRFIAEYLKNFDPRIAILVAGYKGQDPARDGNKLIQEPGVQNEILRVIEARAQALADATPDLFQRLWLIVSADINELVQITHGCCRHCWGKDFDYQRTPYERRMLLKRGEEADTGDYYDRHKPPNPDCPECFGDGETKVRHTPSEKLSPAARALCAGYVQTKEGPRLKVHNQQRALEILVRYQNNWIKPKPPPPAPEPYKSAEEKAREERFKRQWMDGTFDPVAHEKDEARYTVTQQTERIEMLRKDIARAESAIERAENILALPDDQTPAALAIAESRARHGEAPRPRQIPQPQQQQQARAGTRISPPPEGGGQGRGMPQ